MSILGESDPCAYSWYSECPGNDKGSVVWTEPSRIFSEGKKADKEREPAEEGSMTLCVAARKQGQYAVVVYHDENDNRKFDRNWIGLPTEGFGVSNNPSLFFAPPSFEEAAFEVNGELTHVEVEVQY